MNLRTFNVSFSRADYNLITLLVSNPKLLTVLINSNTSSIDAFFIPIEDNYNNKEPVKNRKLIVTCNHSGSFNCVYKL